MSCIGVMGDDGTGGRILMRGGGRFFGLPLGLALGVRSKEGLMAVAGTGGSSKEDLWAGADGGTRRRRWRALGVSETGLPATGESGSTSMFVDEESSSVGSPLEQLVSVKPPPTPSSSCSSSSSTRFSLRKLPVLAIEPVRFLAYFSLQAGPIPSPVEVVDATDEVEVLRATRRNSIAWSRA